MIVGFVFSIIQPLGGPGDENAHVHYVQFLANTHRLPIWQPNGGGEADYESQHPPLYYAMAAVVYKISGGIAENWRWHVLRWFSLILGAALFLVARKFFLEYFRGQFAPAFAATATFMLTPLTIMHISYINVDILSVLMCSVILLMCLRMVRRTVTIPDRVILSLALGFGMITKFTVIGTLPMIIFAHFRDSHVDIERAREQRMVRFLYTVLGAVAISGWWYARNSYLYKTPFIHTTGRFGSGLQLAEITGQGMHLLMLTLRETYLSIWAQRGWLHPGPLEISVYAILTVLLSISAYQGISSLCSRKGKSIVSDPGNWMAGLFFASLVIGHQMQVWMVDYEFNAGGRYLLNGFMALLALIFAGLYKTKARTILLLHFIAVALIMDAISAHRIWTVLNPQYAPGWHIFQFRP